MPVILYMRSVKHAVVMVGYSVDGSSKKVYINDPSGAFLNDELNLGLSPPYIAEPADWDIVAQYTGGTSYAIAVGSPVDQMPSTPPKGTIDIDMTSQDGFYFSYEEKPIPLLYSWAYGLDQGIGWEFVEQLHPSYLNEKDLFIFKKYIANHTEEEQTYRLKIEFAKQGLQPSSLTTDPFSVPKHGRKNAKMNFTPLQDYLDESGEYEITLTLLDETGETEYDKIVFPPIEYRIGQIPTATADVALIIDSSGSMEDNDPNDLRKDAAKFFIDLAEPGTQIAVVDFDAGARTYASLTSVDVPENKQALKNAVDRVNSDGGTDLGRGLKQGYNELVASAFPDVKKAGVMLTDGKGDYSNQASLYADKGWSVYTVGLSENVDENLLRRIAESTPEGEYFSASLENMQTIYNLILARVTDKSILSNYKGFINQGQEVFKDVFIDLVEQVIFAINWQGSKIDLVLIDPDSNEITPADAATNPDIDYKESSTFAIYTVNSPTSGEWKMKAKGTDIPPEGEQYNLTVTATSDLITNLLALDPSYSVGDTVRIGIRIKEKIGDTSEPVLGATASAEIVRPDGKINSLELFDDGSHNDMKAGDGVYANNYTNVDKEGKYLIRVNATNDFSREIQDEVIVGALDNVYIDGGTLTPPAGATLDKSPDIISAVISGPSRRINEDSIELKLDGQVVQHSYDAVNQVVSYQPPEVLPGGQHTVNLSLKDTNGKLIETTWTFTTPQTLVNVSAESAFADREFLISVLSEAGAEVLADVNELNVDITEPIMLKAGEAVEEGTRYTGVVKVNVKEVGIKTFTVTVQNKAGQQISKDFSVEVLPLTHSEFTISLARGINLMSLPLKPDKVRISGLAELIGPELEMIIHHQPQANRLVGYEPSDSPGSKYDAQIGAGFFLCLFSS